MTSPTNNTYNLKAAAYVARFARVSPSHRKPGTTAALLSTRIPTLLAKFTVVADANGFSVSGWQEKAFVAKFDDDTIVAIEGVARVDGQFIGNENVAYHAKSLTKTDWVAANELMASKFNPTPTIVNPNPTYSIRYGTPAEIPAKHASSIESKTGRRLTCVPDAYWNARKALGYSDTYNAAATLQAEQHYIAHWPDMKNRKGTASLKYVKSTQSKVVYGKFYDPINLRDALDKLRAAGFSAGVIAMKTPAHAIAVKVTETGYTLIDNGAIPNMRRKRPAITTVMGI